MSNTAPGAAAPLHLDRGSLRILRSCIAAMRPRGHGFDQPIDDDVLRTIDDYLKHLPPLLQIALPLGMRLLEWGPPLFAHPRRLTTMSRLPLEEQQHYVESWLQAGGVRGNLALGLRTLVFLTFYQHPTVIESLGVDWEGRARQLTRQRAELLAGRPVGMRPSVSAADVESGAESGSRGGPEAWRTAPAQPGERGPGFASLAGDAAAVARRAGLLPPESAK